MPEVTVVIPTYNRVRFVGRAIRSALAQTYSDIEVVIVDDGSTDDTQTQIESLAQADERVRYLRYETNRGAQAARNTGIRAARGEYIAFLDSDNEWLPEKLELQMALFSQAGDRFGVVYAGYRQVSSDDGISTEHLPMFRGDVYKTALARWIADTSTLVIRKDVLEKAGLCDERIRAFQEWDLCIRLARYAEFDFVPQPLSIYHIHSLPTISKNLLLSAWGYLDVVKAHRDEILRECGAATLSRHYISAGQQFILADRFDLARQSFLQAVRVTPAYPKALLHISAALFGRRGYEVLRSIKRRVRSLNLGLSSNSPSTHLISGARCGLGNVTGGSEVTPTHNVEQAGSDLVERICWGETCLAYIIRASFLPDKTTFLTPPEFKQQVGYIVYPAGGEIKRHVHRSLERHLVGTSEVLIVKKGRCLIDIYNDDRELVATRELYPGDLMLMVGGGHGFRMLEDTVLLEIKQGPYTGLDEKERF